VISAAELLGIITIRGADEGVLKLARVGESADSAGAKLAGLAVGGTVLAAAGLLALGAAAVKMDADLQQGVNRLKTGGGDIQDTFASLRSSIQSVALMSGILTGPLTDAMYLIVSAGQRGSQALATEAAAAQGAQIEMANVVDVTKILTTLQTNWGLKTYTATQYMDGLVAVVKNGKINLEDLSTKLSAILPIAAEFGISFKDIASAMAVQTNAGLDAAKSATGLQSVMVNLENPTAKAAKAMKQFGVDGTAVANEMKVSLPGAFQMLIDAALKVGPMGSVPFNQAMADMVGGGTRTSKTIDALDEHMNAWREDIKQVNTAMGDTSKNVAGWDTAQSNLNVQIERGQAFLQVMGQNIGEELLPYVSQLLADVLPLGEGFAAWATSTQGLAGDINQLAAFVTYLVRAVQDNGAIKEFGAIMSDIGQTVGNVVNAAMLTLSGLFGTTASQAGKASDAATNVANGFKRVLDTIKPLTDLMSWLSQQFADAGVKGQILRGVLLTVGGAFAGIKIAEFAGALGTALANAGLDVQYFGAKLLGMQYAADIDAMSLTKVGVAAESAGTSAAASRVWFVQLEATLDGTAASAVATGTAFGGMRASVAALGTALGPIIGIATGVRLALGLLPSTMPGIHDMGAQIDKMTLSVGGMWHMVDDNSKQQAQDTKDNAAKIAAAAQQMASNVSVAMNTMASNSLAAIWDFVGKAGQSFGSLAAQVGLDMQNIDANAKGYWADVANYIEGNPIVGSISYQTGGSATMSHFAEGTNYAPGGWAVVGERGPELAYIPQGAQIIPHNQSVAQSSSSASSGRPVVIQFVINGRQLAQAALPDFVQAIREATGAKF
jgi:TP901 family phage tail tape measure protein